MPFKRFLFTFGVMLGCICIFLYFVIFSTPSVEKDIRSQYLKGGNFQLLNADKPFELNQLKGKPVVLYFGYTHCPDVCPVGLAVIRDAINSSAELADVPVLFVTLDPERDTTEVLDQYVEFFHPNIIPLRGTNEQIKQVIESYGGFFRGAAVQSKSGSQLETSYSVDHSAYYYVIDSAGELTKVYDHSISSEKLAETLKSLL